MEKNVHEPVLQETVVEITPSQDFKQAMTVSWVSYIVQLITVIALLLPGMQFSLVVLLIVFIVDLVIRDKANNTWLYSHFVWRNRTVLWAGVWYIVTVPLWLLFILPGMIAWGLVSLWCLYRIIKGMIKLNEREQVL